MGSSWTRDWTHVPCIGRQILNYETHQERPLIYLCISSLSCNVLHLVAQSCLTLSNPMDCSSPGCFLSLRFSRQAYWSGCHALLQGALPNPEIESRSPSLQVDSLLFEPSRKPRNTGAGSLSLLQGIFPIQKAYQGLLYCRKILYQLSYQGSPCPSILQT